MSAALVLTPLAAGAAPADVPLAVEEPVDAVPPPDPLSAVLPTAGALVPGLLLHGTGPFLAGDRDAAL
ncbi:MAG: hypothetical protein ACK4N5_25595, partial [Myxococcales bacterium]